MDKTDEIRSAAESLLAAYGAAIALVDDWPADPSALGVVRRGAAYPRVYFSADTRVVGTFAVSLELPPAPGSELPYRDRGWLDDVDLAGLLAAVDRHLGLSPAPS